MKKYLFIVLVAVFFLALGYYMEQSPYFEDTRDKLQKVTLPSPPIRFGRRGEIMDKLGLKYLVPNDYSKYFNPKSREFSLRDIISLESAHLEYEDRWTVPDQLDPAKLPSSMIMDDTVIQTGLPIISVVVDEFDLYDERTGIFTNHQKKGKQWERLSFLSYYNNGKLLFGSGAGVRVHGGGDRSMKYKGLRFYFRDVYGADRFKPGILFDKKREPIQRLIVRKEPAFFNALALDISRKIGCMGPHTQPVKVYFNGSLYDDQFVLTEHISEDYLFSIYGHDNFLIERTIKRRRDRSEAFEELRDWAMDKNIKMTMAEAKKKVDVENLSLWWISQLFCAGKDHYQGPAVLDKTKENAKWFWINWDMDQCFRNTREKEKEIWEQELCLNEVMNSTSSLDRKDPRGVLFRRMMTEDPEYKIYFENLLTEVLNHRLSRGYLESRIQYYEKAGKEINIPDFEGTDIRLFYKKRSIYLRKLMQKYFTSPESYLCKIKIQDDIEYEIDDYPYHSDYEGMYFKGSRIKIKLFELDNHKIFHWFVNGKQIEEKDNLFELIVNRNVVIEIVYSPN